MSGLAKNLKKWLRNLLTNMKKLFAIVVLGLLWNGNAFANRRDHVNMKWGLEGRLNVLFTFLNNSNKPIEITEYGVLTKNEQTIAKYKIPDKPEYLGNIKVISGGYLGAFGRKDIRLNVYNKNTALIHYAYYRCRYDK